MKESAKHVDSGTHKEKLLKAEFKIKKKYIHSKTSGFKWIKNYIVACWLNSFLQILATYKDWLFKGIVVAVKIQRNMPSEMFVHYLSLFAQI